ncbi:MAG: hypothetical protein HRK26_00420 [Rickettsiaceae bacterium H1]|nr:hypothetical protein [Rickettsiaceae bacterium H1]
MRTTTYRFTLKHISEFRSLRSCTVLAANVTGQGLKNIAKCTSLESLELGVLNENITSEELRYLNTLDSLEDLYIYGDIIIEDQCLKSISHIISLTSLRIKCSIMNKCDWSFNENLSSLELIDSNINSLAFVGPDVSSLTISGKISENCLEDLVKLQKLKSLDLKFCKIKKEHDYEYLTANDMRDVAARMPNLTLLQLHENEIPLTELRLEECFRVIHKVGDVKECSIM